MRILSFGLLGLWLVGCGQTGSLFLPEKPDPNLPDDVLTQPEAEANVASESSESDS